VAIDGKFANKIGYETAINKRRNNKQNNTKTQNIHNRKQTYKTRRQTYKEY
jgi:hypothetical protein